MLTSSDAKFRCLWHMLVWSVMLILVSQFFILTDHIAYFLCAALCNLMLPLVTSIYSNTAGRHGAGLLRVSYVFCDPVLACITVIPVLLLNRLPRLVSEHICLSQLPLTTAWNDTLACLYNITSHGKPSHVFTDPVDVTLPEKVRSRLTLIQISLVFPILLTLAMGRRTRKMSYNTVLVIFCYWLIAGIEAADLIETAVILSPRYQHVVYTTEAIVSIVMIICNSYSIVTLCSYISPMGSKDDRTSRRRFNFLYRVLSGAAGVLFVETPLLVARCQIIFGGGAWHRSPAVFYMWLIKDVLLIVLIIVTVVLQKIGLPSVMQPCGISFDNPDVFFQPEKRDVYIVRHKLVPAPRISSISDDDDDAGPSTSGMSIQPPTFSHDGDDGGTKKTKRVTFRFDLSHGRRTPPPLMSKIAASHDDVVLSDNELVPHNVARYNVIPDIMQDSIL